jgi:hypothetical protein
MSTVVGEVSMKVPVPLPLKGTGVAADAIGNALSIVRRPKILRIRIFMVAVQIPLLSIRVPRKNATQDHYLPRWTSAKRTGLLPIRG